MFWNTVHNSSSSINSVWMNSNYDIILRRAKRAVHVMRHYYNTRADIDKTVQIVVSSPQLRHLPFVVVPRHELDKVVGEGDASSGVEDGRSSVPDEVRRHYGILRVPLHDTHSGPAGQQAFHTTRQASKRCQA